MLEARADYHVTNVFDEALPGDDLRQACAAAPEMKTWDGYELDRLGGVGWLRPDYLRHLDRLGAELRDAGPNLIVPLGPVATWAFTGSSDIANQRGAAQAASLLIPGAKILPTYHPEHVMQDWRLFHVFVADLMKAAREAEFPEVRHAALRIHIRPSVADLAKWKRRLLAAPRLAVDIETAKQQITCIGFAPSEEEAFVIPFVDYERASRCYWDSVEDEAAAWQMVREVCESAVPKTLQNGLYDAYYLVRQAGIWLGGYDSDTRMQHHALYPELPKSLAFMVATYGNAGAWKMLAAHRTRGKKDD